jgi:RNA polymerase sigma-70 factor, ECF subfamily
MPSFANRPPASSDAPSQPNPKLTADVTSLYEELHQIARRHMRGERADHTLSATALVNEAYLKLKRTPPEGDERGQFLAAAANAMRQILVNHALARRTDKRGGEWTRLTLTSALPEIEKPSTDAVEVIALDAALTELAALDAIQAKVVELRYFAGLTIEETAEAMNLSATTVKRHWAVARLFLKRCLTE